MGLQSVLRIGQERTRSWQQGWGGDLWVFEGQCWSLMSLGRGFVLPLLDGINA